MYQKEHAVRAHGHGLITRAVAAGLLFCDGLGVYTTKTYRPGFPHVLGHGKNRRDREGEAKKNRQTKRVEVSFVFVFDFGTFFCFPAWLAKKCIF